MSSGWTLSTSSPPWQAQPQQNVGITGTCGSDSSGHANRSPSASFESRESERATSRQESSRSGAQQSSTCEATARVEVLPVLAGQDTHHRSRPGGHYQPKVPAATHAESQEKLRQWGTSSKGSGADVTTTTAKSVVKAAASANGNSTPRAALQSWPDTMPTGWRRARAVFQRKRPKDVKMTTRTLSGTWERWMNARRKVGMKRAV